MRHESEDRVLRVGLIHNGRIVEERLFRKPQDISVGTSKSAVFSVPAAGLPEKRGIFAVKKGRYHLACGDDLPFRVTSAGSTSERRAADSHSRLTTHDASQPMLLAEDAHGRVQVGAVTVLFQFVTPPPAPPKLQLPEMTMVRWSSRVDRSFAAILSWVVMIHVGVVMAVQSAPLPKEPTGFVDDLGRIIDRVVVVPPGPAEKEEDENEGEQNVPDERPETGGSAATATSSAPVSATKVTRDEVRNLGVLKFLTAKGPKGSAITQVLSGDGIRASEAFDGVVSNNVASLGEKLEKGRIGIGGDDRGPGSIEPLATGTGSRPGGVSGPGTAGPKVAWAPPPYLGVIELEPPEVEGCLDPTAISRVVKSRLRLVQDCYEKELKKNPSLSGKVTVRFTIDGTGAVTDARMEIDQLGSPAAADCILGKIRRLKFPKSDCGSIPVSYPFVFVKTQ